MIQHISEILVKKLLSKGYFSSDDAELYIYGFFVLFSQSLYFLVVILIGSIFHILIESIVFFLVFQLLRKYAGGYHASTEAQCEMLSTLSIIISLGLIKLSRLYDIQIGLLIFSLYSASFIFFLSPLDTPEKPLSVSEKKHFRKLTWIYLFFSTALLFVSYFLKFSVLFSPCCMSLILESVLLLAGKIKVLRTAKSS